jgi:hypothetical protein
LIPILLCCGGGGPSGGGGGGRGSFSDGGEIGSNTGTLFCWVNGVGQLKGDLFRCLSPLVEPALLFRLRGSARAKEPGVEGVLLFTGDELEGGGVGITWWPAIRSIEGGVLWTGSDPRRGGG